MMENDSCIQLEDINLEAGSDTEPLLQAQADHNPCCHPKYTSIFFAATTFTFLLLWLSESQFGQGTLRLRHLGEECHFSIFGSKDCAPGFTCSTEGICVLPSCPDVPCIPQNCSTPTPCPPCPPVKPRLVTYFDFNETPNHWIDPGPHGYYKIAHHLSYGACKELCAQDTHCHSFNYKGDAGMCAMLDKTYYPAPSYNSTWNAATKIL